MMSCNMRCILVVVLGLVEAWGQEGRGRDVWGGGGHCTAEERPHDTFS